MNEDSGSFEALDRVSGELRAAEGPALDWTRVESELMQSVERVEAERQGRVARTLNRPGILRAFGFAAAAGVLMILGASASRTSPAAPTTAAVVESAPTHGAVAVAALPERGDHDLFELHDGDVIEARGGSVGFGHAGLLRWTLASGGRAVVRSMGRDGVGHTVALERGSLRAEVTPRAPSEGMVEAFAVEIEGTRVAVHGTAFTVTRVDDNGAGAIVDVEHGAVAVGPVGHVGETSGHLLVGPARARFSLDGGRTASWLAPSTDAAPAMASANGGKAAKASPLPDPFASAGSAGSEPAEVAEAIASPSPRALAPHPAAAQVEDHPEVAAPATTLSRASVEAQIARCFHQVYDGLAGDTNLSVASTLRLKLKEDGSVRSAGFDPPLRPELSNCAGGAIQGRFPPGTADLTLPFHYSK